MFLTIGLIFVFLLKCVHGTFLSLLGDVDVGVGDIYALKDSINVGALDKFDC